jgi:hypothetical protein
MFCIFIDLFFLKYSAWRILKLCLYKGMYVLFCNQVLKCQLNFKYFRVIFFVCLFGEISGYLFPICYFLPFFLIFFFLVFYLQFIISTTIICYQNNLSNVPRQLVLKLKRLLGVIFFISFHDRLRIWKSPTMNAVYKTWWLKTYRGRLRS